MPADKLGEPESIGTVTVPNRIVMAPMISNLCNPDGSTNDNHIAYLEERAKGGAGMVITEYSHVNGRNARGSRNQMALHRDDYIPKLRRLTERLHSHGTVVFTQLVHAGGKALAYNNPVWPEAPTSLDYNGTLPSEMSLDDIRSAIEDFVKAADIARRSHFDGVELHGAHGYLIQEFISPALNRRADRYGGSLEGRVRFAQEIVDAIRSQMDTNIGIRLSLYEDDPDGYGPDYGLAAADSLNSIDYVHFSAGRFAPPGSSAAFYAGKTHIAERLPRKARVKTIMVGSVTSREEALHVLEKADFVAVGRAMLADPHFASKILSGSMIPRPCIRCNQACRDNALGEVRCTVNPSTGLEAAVRREPRAQGEVVIVGAGVKGMEAALHAAKAGLKVTLHEKRDSLGGQLLDITDESKRKEFYRLVEYYSEALRLAGVSVVLGSAYTGKGVYCLPDRVYERLPENAAIAVDSNIYQHHDQLLTMAGKVGVTMSGRSLSSLDRSRAASYRAMAEKHGIYFNEGKDMEFDVVVSERRQYDIRAAMVSGRAAVDRYLRDSGIQTV